MATESQPIDIDDESDVVDLCDKSSEDDDDSVVDLTAASPASPKRRRSVIDIEDEAVARQLELEEQRAAKRRKKAEERDARVARKLAAEEKRKAEEKKRADAVKRKNAAERAAKEKRKSVDTDELASTPTGLAAIVTEYTRDSKKWAIGLELKNACANFDLAVKFFEKHAAMLARAPCPRSGRNKGTRATPLAIVYHGTSRSNFRAIMEGNLRVPDGRQVKHVTDDGFFGRGIYTTTDPRLAFAYAKDAIVFACLALPGRQYKATQKRDRGVPKKPGYDSHLGYEGDGAPQLVFFDTDQVLPCYLVDQRNHTRAHAALERAVKCVAEKTGNARPSDGIPRNRSGRRAMPAPGAYAAGAGAPVAPGGAPPPPTGGVMPPGLAAYISMITGGGGGYGGGPPPGYGGGPPPGYGPPPGFFGGGGYGGADY